MFNQIKESALKVMTNYKTDLDIDAREIESKPGIPYLHFTRQTGTCS